MLVPCGVARLRGGRNNSNLVRVIDEFSDSLQHVDKMPPFSK